MDGRRLWGGLSFVHVLFETPLAAGNAMPHDPAGDDSPGLAVFWAVAAPRRRLAPRLGSRGWLRPWPCLSRGSRRGRRGGLWQYRRGFALEPCQQGIRHLNPGGALNDEAL